MCECEQFLNIHEFLIDSRSGKSLKQGLKSFVQDVQADRPMKPSLIQLQLNFHKTILRLASIQYSLNVNDRIMMASIRI